MLCRFEIYSVIEVSYVCFTPMMFLQEHEKRCWSVDFNLMDPKLLASGSDDAKGNVETMQFFVCTSPKVLINKMPAGFKGNILLVSTSLVFCY